MSNTYYLNTDEELFLNETAEFYVDKTGLLEFTNNKIKTRGRYICVTRPRRFGKSIAAQMLNAYYSKGANSKELFSKYKISKTEDFETHLNKHNVIYIDFNNIKAKYEEHLLNFPKDNVTILSTLNTVIVNEIKEIYSDLSSVLVYKTIGSTLDAVYKYKDEKFIFIIDEWDLIFRDYANDTKLCEEYLTFLRGMFKNSGYERFIELVYMTGILPIKRYKTESALNNFNEYTFLSPLNLMEFAGFTEEEVIDICSQYDFDIEEVRRWYDGYKFKNTHIYNPKAISMLVSTEGEFDNYWSKTGSFTNIVPYISMNFEGLKDDIIKLLHGDRINLPKDTFSNDLVSFNSKNDVLVYLVHLGYLAFDKNELYIPNEEIKQEFSKAIDKTDWTDFLSFIKESEDNFINVLNGNTQKVAAFLEKRHDTLTSILKYNDENSLSYVVRDSFLAAEFNYYYTPIRELPSGKGFADLVYIPRNVYSSKYPVLIIELKKDKTADEAIVQIYDREYVASLKERGTHILLIGVNYDSNTKKHSCVIKQYKE